MPPAHDQFFLNLWSPERFPSKAALPSDCFTSSPIAIANGCNMLIRGSHARMNCQPDTLAADRKFLNYGKHDLRKQCHLDREDSGGGEVAFVFINGENGQTESITLYPTDGLLGASIEEVRVE